MKPKIFPERRRGRVNVSLSARSQIKLKQIAISCNKPKTTMGQLFIDYCLDRPEIVHDFQAQYNTNPEYWVKLADRDYHNRSYLIGGKPHPPEPKYGEVIEVGALIQWVEK